MPLVVRVSYDACLRLAFPYDRKQDKSDLSNCSYVQA